MKRHVRLVVWLMAFALVVEFLVLRAIKLHENETIRRDHLVRMKQRELSHLEQKDAINQKFEESMYLAAGTNAYARIYARDQTIIELIGRVADEALPDNWSSAVEVDEFTNFLLLVQHHQSDQPNLVVILRLLDPVLRLRGEYLSNVAIYDMHHRCVAYLTEDLLLRIRSGEDLTDGDLAEAKRRGQSFHRFNAVAIEGRMAQGHMFVPVTIYFKRGVAEVDMMLDTGASMTVISAATAARAGVTPEELASGRVITFTTANGRIDCRIVQGRLSVAGIDRVQGIAVNSKGETDLLGMDFFHGKSFTVDTNRARIYMWDK